MGGYSVFRKCPNCSQRIELHIEKSGEETQSCESCGFEDKKIWMMNKEGSYELNHLRVDTPFGVLHVHYEGGSKDIFLKNEKHYNKQLKRLVNDSEVKKATLSRLQVKVIPFKIFSQALSFLQRKVKEIVKTEIKLAHS